LGDRLRISLFRERRRENEFIRSLPDPEKGPADLLCRIPFRFYKAVPGIKRARERRFVDEHHWMDVPHLSSLVREDMQAPKPDKKGDGK
jgi:hypothetical protein